MDLIIMTDDSRKSDRNIITKVVIITSLIDPKMLEQAKTGCADGLWYKDHEAGFRMPIHRTLDGEHVFGYDTMWK